MSLNSYRPKWNDDLYTHEKKTEEHLTNDFEMPNII